MTEIILEQIEKEYFKSHIIGNKYPNNDIEKQILESFSKEDLLSLKVDMEIKYFDMKNIYLKDLNAEKDNYSNLTELEEYFIEQIFYYFRGGYELQLSINFIEKIENYYKWNHTNRKNLKTQYIDFNTIPIVPFVSQFIKVPGNLKDNIICPLKSHKEKTGSFHIYEKTNTFKCFGCGKYGGAVSFVEGYYGISNKEACKKVLEIFNNK